MSGIRLSPFRLAGVMGWPIGHSRSPLLHGHWLKRHGIAGAYRPLAVPPEKLGEALRALPLLGYAGVNLTVPLKEAALPFLDRIDARSARLGSVNTVVVTTEGRLEGFSTDGPGFLADLRQRAPGWQPARPVVLLGAGGAARAIIGSLLDAGVSTLRLANRSQARAEAVAEAFAGVTDNAAIEVVPWDRRDAALTDAGLLVNCTSLGMAGQPALDIDPAGLPDDAVVYDIVYNPLETPLLAAARRRGLLALDGLGMLMHQARPGFAAWFGVEPDVDDELRQVLLQTLS